MLNPRYVKLHIIKRLPAIIGAALVCVLFALYYVGVFDVSFIERPESWEGNLQQLKSFLAGERPIYEDEDEEDEETTETEPPAETEEDEGKAHNTYAKKGNKRDSQVLEIDTVEKKLAEGYSPTSKVWNDNCVFATLKGQVDWPLSFSYSKETRATEKFTEHEDGGETTVEIIDSTDSRPAVELYMGYILYDDCGTLYIMNSNGQVMMPYDDNIYRPAYTRDKEGRPLFYNKTTEYLTYPTKKDKKDKDGTEKWLETDEILVDKYNYYYIPESGNAFLTSEYNDTTDNRGLYFDYPAYYGLTDGNFKRYYLNTSKIVTSKDGKKTEFVDACRWLYSDDYEFTLKDYEFTKDGYVLNKKAEETTGPDTDKKKLKKTEDMFPFAKAYNMVGGYATVVREVKWDYYHEEEDKKTGELVEKQHKVAWDELRVVNTSGDNMFESQKAGLMVHDWTAVERFLEPLSKSISSLGSYYFDHGLIRIRKQAFDRYYYTDLDNQIFVVQDKDVLVNASGQEFNLPTGYELISYSDGVALLKKDETYRYYTYSGSWLVDRNFSDAGPCLEGVMVCKNAEGMYGAISISGKTVIPFRYDYMSNVSSGLVAAYKDGSGWTVFQKLTK